MTSRVSEATPRASVTTRSDQYEASSMRSPQMRGSTAPSGTTPLPSKQRLVSASVLVRLRPFTPVTRASALRNSLAWGVAIRCIDRASLRSTPVDRPQSMACALRINIRSVPNADGVSAATWTASAKTPPASAEFAVTRMLAKGASAEIFCGAVRTRPKTVRRWRRHAGRSRCISTAPSSAVISRSTAGWSDSASARCR